MTTTTTNPTPIMSYDPSYGVPEFVWSWLVEVAGVKDYTVGQAAAQYLSRYPGLTRSGRAALRTVGSFFDRSEEDARPGDASEPPRTLDELAAAAMPHGQRGMTAAQLASCMATHPEQAEAACATIFPELARLTARGTRLVLANLLVEALVLSAHPVFHGPPPAWWSAMTAIYDGRHPSIRWGQTEHQSRLLAALPPAYWPECGRQLVREGLARPGLLLHPAITPELLTDFLRATSTLSDAPHAKDIAALLPQCHGWGRDDAWTAAALGGTIGSPHAPLASLGLSALAKARRMR